MYEDCHEGIAKLALVQPRQRRSPRLPPTQRAPNARFSGGLIKRFTLWTGQSPPVIRSTVGWGAWGRAARLAASFCRGQPPSGVGSAIVIVFAGTVVQCGVGDKSKGVGRSSCVDFGPARLLCQVSAGRCVVLVMVAGVRSWCGDL